MASRISRIKTVLWCILVFTPAPLLSAQTALHLVVERRFSFMGSKQATTIEYWITDDKMYERQGSRVIIHRKDLEVLWLIDNAKKTYSETRSTAPARNAKRAEEDIRTAGFGLSYEPKFAWQVAVGRKVSTIHGRTCRLTTATGTDDFAEMTLKLWLCSSNRSSLERQASMMVLQSARFGYQSPVHFVAEFLSRRPRMLLMSLEADLEPPISPSMHYHVAVITIEKALPPDGMFELPLGVQKRP